MGVMHSETEFNPTSPAINLPSEVAPGQTFTSHYIQGDEEEAKGTTVCT